MKYSALFFLVVAGLSGCSLIRDIQRPGDGAEALKYRKLFEAGRRAEVKGDVKIAGDTYDWLIGRGNRYGEYGRAMLLLRREPDSREAIKNLISCAKRSNHTSDLFPDSAMDSAFSVAAMAKLSEIVVSEHDWQDVASWLRNEMSSVVTQQVKDWAAGMKADPDAATIYKDVISAVESSRRSDEYAKSFKWPEISGILLNGKADDASNGGCAGSPTGAQYSMVRFEKVPGTGCKYDFEARLSGGGTFEATTEKVRSTIRRLLVREFLSENPHAVADDIRTSFPSWKQTELSIVGSVLVMKVSAVRLEYNAKDRCGTIAVRLDGNDMIAARKWAVENIAELATGKNVALVVGKAPPPGATYTVGAERMTEDGLLEIEFTTEG